MKNRSRSIRIIISMAMIAMITACGGSDDGVTGLPYGNYTSEIHDLSLSTGGTFSIVHRPTSYDSRNYTIAGNFTSTLDVNDPANDTYGKITLTVTTISSDGTDYQGIDDPFCESSLTCYREVWVDSVMEGWWAYSSNITWGGSFRLWFNDPGIPRSIAPYEGGSMLISVDPR